MGQNFHINKNISDRYKTDIVVDGLDLANKI